MSTRLIAPLIFTILTFLSFFAVGNGDRNKKPTVLHLRIVRVTAPVLGYRMRVTCLGCCVSYDNNMVPIRTECDIKGSFTDFLPIIIRNSTPPAEDNCSFRLFENSKLGKPAAGFDVVELYNNFLNQTVTRPLFNNYEGPYDLKAFLQFTNGPMILKVQTIVEFFSGGKLLSASITATKG